MKTAKELFQLIVDNNDRLNCYGGFYTIENTALVLQGENKINYEEYHLITMTAYNNGYIYSGDPKTWMPLCIKLAKELNP